MRCNEPKMLTVPNCCNTRILVEIDPFSAEVEYLMLTWNLSIFVNKKFHCIPTTSERQANQQYCYLYWLNENAGPA